MASLKEQMRVAVIGQGAREHAIVWKLAQSPYQPQLFVLPGNPGMWELATRVDVSAANHGELVEWAKANEIDLVVVGPEQPLAEGVVDALKQAGIRAFGPEQAAAELEASKSFAKQLMDEANVPTARFQVFTTASDAKAYVREIGVPIVIKADGLAAGKGVVIVQSLEDADSTIEDMLEGNRFGASGHKVVIEEFLTGQEASLMYFVDGNAAVPMIPARDFKRLLDNDEGPNTGGMGAFAPVPAFGEELVQTVTNNIVQPVRDALREKGIVYRGVLYVGLMVTKEGPKVIEFNARFGDPETEVVLPLLATDLLEVMWATTEDKLSMLDITWHDDAAVCVVLAGGEYPAKSDKGTKIDISDNVSADTVVFHAGTAQQGTALVTAGGRVLTISTVAPSIPEAINQVYNQIQHIHFDKVQYRRDIASNWQL